MLRRIAWLIFASSIIATPAVAIDPGSPVPEVELPALSESRTLRLSDLRGKVVYVDFWASWCPPCRLSLPELEQIRNEIGGDFEVFAINIDEDPELARHFLEQHPVSYPIASDSKSVFPPLFDLKGMPTSYLVDREGVVRYVHEGYRRGDGEKIREVVQQLLSE